MLKSVRLITVLVGLVTLLAMGTVFAATSSTPTRVPKTYIEFGNRAVLVSQHAKVGVNGHLTDEGRCQMPAFWVRTTDLGDFSHAAATLTLTKECELEVTSLAYDDNWTLPDKSDQQASQNNIRPNRSRPFPLSLIPQVFATTEVEYRGWAKSELDDFWPFYLDLTASYAELYYYDDGSSVYDGYNGDGWCSTTGQTGWYQVSCTFDWSPYGPSQVWAGNEGEFDNYNFVDVQHSHQAFFIGTPGSWTKECYFNPTSAPAPLTHYQCQGDRVPQ